MYSYFGDTTLGHGRFKKGGDGALAFLECTLGFGDRAYVFSGTRPSSGAATSACSKAMGFTDKPLALDAATPGDGRAPCA